MYSKENLKKNIRPLKLLSSLHVSHRTYIHYIVQHAPIYIYNNIAQLFKLLLLRNLVHIVNFLWGIRNFFKQFTWSRKMMDQSLNIYKKPYSTSSTLKYYCNPSYLDTVLLPLNIFGFLQDGHIHSASWDIFILCTYIQRNCFIHVHATIILKCNNR